MFPFLGGVAECRGPRVLRPTVGVTNDVVGGAPDEVRSVYRLAEFDELEDDDEIAVENDNW